ncbi:benzoate 4-monooxygenase cytochrome P450 [Apiospora sp. TS-2023a]
MSWGTMASFTFMATTDIWSISLMIAAALLSFSTLSALKTIHAKGAPVFKGDEFYGLLDGGPEGGRSLQMERAPESHAARRRVLDRAMPARDEAFRTINGLAGVLVDVIREEGRPLDFTEGDKGTDGSGILEVDINQVASWYGFDLITTLAFGQSLDLLRTDEYRWLPRCLQDASVFLYWAGFFRYALGLWRRFLGSKWPARLRMHTAVEAQRYADLADSQVYRRLDRLAQEDEEKVTGTTSAAGTTEDCTDDEVNRKKKDTKDNDIFGHLLRANLYSRIDLRADSSLLIAAGSDAVRFTITTTLFHWTTQSPPTSLVRATAEVRTSGLTPSTISDSAVLGQPLRYLRACVDEAMRLNPPKPSSIPREVAHSPGMVIDGVVVPPGATVGVCTYALHRDADTYRPDPHAFRPERWLARPLDTRMLAAFCPFLKGPRACPGKTVAYLAVQLALFHLLYAFDIEAADDGKTGEAAEGSVGKVEGGRNDFAFNDWVIGYAQGLNIRFKPRM